jgi:hypothetical protein
MPSPRQRTVSEKQLAANRANALKSTGPTSPDGRARSAQNSRKHGFTAAQFTLAGFEDPEELEALRDDLMAFYHPANPQQLYVVERIAMAQQQILRAARLEAGLLSDSNAPDPHHTRKLANRFPTRATGGYAYLDFGLILRYQAQAERQYRRWMEELERLQSLTETPQDDFPNEPIFATQPQENTELRSTGPRSPTPAPQTPAADPHFPAPTLYNDRVPNREVTRSPE